jgi:hypothetical protein
VRPELGDNHDNGVSPSGRPNLFGKACKRAAEFAEAVGEITGGRTLVDVGVPAADIDKAEIELLAHQAADAPGRQFEAARRDRAAIGRGPNPANLQTGIRIRQEPPALPCTPALNAACGVYHDRCWSI